MSSLVASAAGEVLGPRPGKAACSFCQGVLEMVLRVGALVLGVLSIVIGALVIGFNADYEASTNEDNPSQVNLNTTQAVTNAAGAIDVVSGVLVVVWALVMIILRICNIGLLNLKSKVFLAIDIIVTIVLAVISIAGGIISAVGAPDWDSLNGNDSDAVYASLIAASIVCLITGLYLVLLVIFMIIYISKEWNDKIVKYTIKDAVMG